MVLLFRTSLGVSSSENSYDGTELQRSFPIRPHFTVRHVVVISMDVIVRRRLLYADGQETEEKKEGNQTKESTTGHHNHLAVFRWPGPLARGPVVAHIHELICNT